MTDTELDQLRNTQNAKREIEVSMNLLAEIGNYADSLDAQVKLESQDWSGKQAAMVTVPVGPYGQVEEMPDPYDEHEIWRTTKFLPTVTRYSLCAYSFAVFEDCLRRCSSFMRSDSKACKHTNPKIETYKDCIRDCGNSSTDWASSGDWGLMTKIAKVRHSIVHSNGRLSSPTSSDKYKAARKAIEHLGTSSKDKPGSEPLVRLTKEDQVILEAGSVCWVCDRARSVLDSFSNSL